MRLEVIKKMRLPGVGAAVLCGTILMGAFQVSPVTAKAATTIAAAKYPALKTAYASINRIEAIATMAPVLKTVESMPKLLVSRTFLCKLTAYGPGFESTGKRPGDPGYMVTASGKMATPQRTVAVDPQLIPLGSLVYIDGIGYRVAEDVGGAVKGEHIDVYFPNDNEALRFGVRKNVKVIVFHSVKNTSKK